MTMIVFDYADIRSRMLGEDKPAPKAKPVPEPEVLPLVHVRPGMFPLISALPDPTLSRMYQRALEAQVKAGTANS